MRHLFSFFFFKQKTAYEMLLCDWSSDVCSSDLLAVLEGHQPRQVVPPLLHELLDPEQEPAAVLGGEGGPVAEGGVRRRHRAPDIRHGPVGHSPDDRAVGGIDDVKRGAALGERPLAVDVHALHVSHARSSSRRSPGAGPGDPRAYAGGSTRARRAAPYTGRWPSHRDATWPTSQRAVRSNRASPCRGPTSWTPSGRPFTPCMSGTLSAGMPQSVHNVQKAGSPVEPSPSGAVPGAAGVRMAS